MHIYNILAGVILLLFGRKLFWLFLGIVGFLIGMKIAPMFFGDEPRWIQLSIAVGAGCLGAIVAILAQRLAFALGGFFAGMYLALGVGHFFAMADANTTLFIALGGGIIGAIIATLIMDTAITILVCLVGAGAIVGELHLSQTMHILILLLLAGAGFVFQEKLWPAVHKE
ncbi:MAG: DUF4203 domain-containing protein [Syntrophaceae bacterium]|nr:DUF4203 domain-containing protein [Syntrophaceae bacterium]